MKKRLIPITLALTLLLTLIPIRPTALASGEFTATLMGQLDADVSDAVDEWGIGDLPDASVSFNLGEIVTISMEFPEPIKFTGNWTGISTDVPVNDDDHAESIGGTILNFVVDGNDLGSRNVPLIDRDDEGFLTIDIARQWGGDWDAYDLAGMDPFTTLEITFFVGGFLATLMGQLDADVSDAVDEWGIGDLPDASVVFRLGEEATISMEFPEPIKFTGNWTGISTTIPVESDEDAESTGAHITSFIVDGEELGSRPVPLINRDEAGFLTIDIARQWGGDWDAYDLAGMDPFTTLEISFVVPTLAVGVDDPVGAIVTIPPGGNVWFAGTVLYEGRTDDLEPADNDWYEFTEQAMPFEFGVPFTLSLDLGAETATHGVAVWDGYIFVVETDVVDLAPTLFDAAIESILVDGSPVSFDPFVVEVGADRGIRVPLTSGWADEPVLPGYHSIGTFSTLEITLAIWIYGEQENPFGELDEPDEPAPTPTPPPIVRPDDVEPPPAADDQEGLPGWVIPVIIGGVVLIAVIIFVVVMVNKKKENN